MKVLGIVCSPRRQGNTEILMQQALKSAEEAGAETEMFTVAGKTISPCDACESCAKTGQCKIRDDIKPLHEKMLAADAIILGTPIYFWGVSAQAKIVIDRTYAFNFNKALRNKVGAVLIVSRRAGATSGFSSVSSYFNIHRMFFAGGAIGHGDGKGDVRQDERGMAEAAAIGKVVVRYLKKLAPSATKQDVEEHLVMPPKHFPS